MNSAPLRPRGVSFGQHSIITAPISRGESFDATRPRIDSTGLGRPRIDSKVDLGTRLDPPTPESGAQHEGFNSEKTNRQTARQNPHSLNLRKNEMVDDNDVVMKETHSKSSTTSSSSSSSSSTSLATANASLSSTSSNSTFPSSSSSPSSTASSTTSSTTSSSSSSRTNSPNSTKVQIPNSPRAPMLNPTRPLPHQIGLINKNKRSATDELHTTGAYGASAAKKMKVNEKQSLAMAYGKPATVLALNDTTHDSLTPPNSTAISVSHFSGTWKLDSQKSETLYSYLHAMGVSDLAIEAAMKAEAEGETYHVIDIVSSHMEQKFTITRKSRMSDVTMTYPIGVEKVIRQKSGREHRTLITVSLSDSKSPRLVERTVLKSNHTFTVTRTLVGENGGSMNCIQVLRTPSSVVVTRRWFERASAPHDKDDGTDFLKEVEAMEAMEEHYEAFVGDADKIEQMRKQMYQ